MEGRLIQRMLDRAAELKMTQSDLARRCGFDPQLITNWKARGKIPGDRYEQLAAALRWTVDELLGKSGPLKRGVAHPLSQPSVKVRPAFTMQELKEVTELPQVFEVTVPDSALVPLAKAGEVVRLTTGLEPQGGDGVLVRDKDGNLYLRIYRERRPGEWSAHPANENYEPLDAKTYGLTILAVLTGQETRWSRS